MWWLMGDGSLRDRILGVAGAAGELAPDAGALVDPCLGGVGELATGH